MQPVWFHSPCPELTLKCTEDLGSIFFFPLNVHCCCSVTQQCPILCDPMDCSTPVFPVLHHLPKFAQTHVHWVGDAIQPSHPPLSPSPPAFNLSQDQGLFQWVSSLHQVAKVLELQQNPSKEQSGLITFRIDWFDLLAVQGTLKSLLQHHSSKASILRHSALFTVQFSQIHTWLKEKSQLWIYGPLLIK